MSRDKGGDFALLKTLPTAILLELQVRSYNHSRHDFNSNTLLTTILSSGRG
jgi:hypothetical protein